VGGGYGASNKFELSTRIQLMKQNRRERFYYDEKDNIKFEDFI